ncbi:molybdenum cofactor biosynthesis protein MoaE [Streptomyces sp. NPDC021608]|uniref:molybdenum cofactor biosynthesis protein MoaE n=1 Tax=Streptomyces sp. NPDC021608 TaxID=3154903 RepID=UPI0033DE3108
MGVQREDRDAGSLTSHSGRSRGTTSPRWRGCRRLGVLVPPGAEAMMRRVADRTTADCPVRALAAIHRVGDLVMGDLAVADDVRQRGCRCDGLPVPLSAAP